MQKRQNRLNTITTVLNALALMGLCGCSMNPDGTSTGYDAFLNPPAPNTTSTYPAAGTGSGTAISETSWDFSTAADYDYDTTKIEITGNTARLVAVDQADDNNETAGFGGGTHSNTQWNSGSSQVELNAAGLTAKTGNFISRLIDTGSSSATWTSISWTPGFPSGKQLPAANASESGYAAGNIDMTSSKIYYRLNETTGTTFADSTSNDTDGSCSTCPNLNISGQFSYAASFDGTSGQAINVGDGSKTDLQLDPGSLSFAAWVTSAALVANSTLFNKSNAALAAGYGVYYNGSSQICAFYGDKATPAHNACAAFPATSTTFKQVAFVVGASDVKLYIDGSLAATSAGVGSAGLVPADAARIGNGPTSQPTFAWKGKIDELAVWAGALTAGNMTSLYNRGAARLKFQIRACDSSPCSSSAPFVGSDGTNSTYFGESDATSETSLPTVSLTSLSSSLTTGRYFQYKAYFDTDNASLTPILKSISAGPSHYPASGASIAIKTGVAFNRIYGLTHTSSVTLGNIKYMVQVQDGVWLYYTGSTWAVVTGYSNSNAITQLTSVLSSLSDLFGAGTFKWLALLNSDGSTQVELSKVTFKYL